MMNDEIKFKKNNVSDTSDRNTGSTRAMTCSRGIALKQQCSVYTLNEQICAPESQAAQVLLLFFCCNVGTYGNRTRQGSMKGPR